MALGDIYTEQEVDEAIDQMLPGYNHGRPPEMQIPRDLVRTIIRAENMGDAGGVTFANRKSSRDATGVMQVLPSTVRGLKGKYLAPDFPEDLSDQPLTSQVLAGVAAIREMVDRTKTTDWRNIAMQYNAGPEVAAGKKPVPTETQGYLLKGFRAREALGLPETPLPPTANSSTRPSSAFSITPLDQANTAYNMMQSLVPAVQSALFGSDVVQQEAGNNQISALKVAGEAAAQSARTQAEITIGEDNFHRQLLKAVGLDISDPSSALSMELQREANTRQEREALDAKISQMEGISFFDSPLQFLMIQPELQASVAKFNNLANVENRSNQEIARMQTLATTLKSLTPAKSADLIRTKAQADASALLEKAKFDVAQVQERNAAGHAKNQLDAFTLQRNIFHDILQIEGREEDMKLRKLQFDSLLEERADRAESRKLTREQKQRADEQEAALVTGINLYRRAISGSTVPVTKEDIKRMPAEMRGAWYDVILRGNYGNSYADSVPFIERFGNVSQAAQSGNAALMQLVRNINARVEPLMIEIMNKEKQANPFATVKPEIARAMAYSQLFAQDATLANKGANKSLIPQTSPYAIDYQAVANTVAAAGADKQKTVVADVLLDAKTRSPNANLNAILTPRMVVDAVRAKVVSGAVDPAKAAQELASFYRSASDQQYESAGLQYLGLPRFTDYVITPGATGNRTVDLYNPAQIENYLTSEVVKHKRLTNMPFGSMDPLGLGASK